MHQNKNLIVIISDYPYNIGEPFFENEIAFLSSSFNKIYVFSVMGKKNKIQTRHYPGNVICFPLECNHSRIKYCLKGIVSKKEEFNVKTKNFKRTLMNYYVYGRNVEIYKKIIKVTNKNKINFNDCVIYSYWLTLGLSAIKLKQNIEKKYGYRPFSISRCHGYDIYKETNKYNYQPMQKQVVQKLDYVCPISNYGSEYLRKKYPDESGKILTFKLGTKFHIIKKRKNESSTKIFVTCSGLRRVKRLDLFAKGFSLASKKDHNIMWICIGDGGEKARIEQILYESNTTNQVIFLGNITNEKIYEYYNNNYVYCFVNVSSSEGIPVAIMEAISYGIPVIATDVGGNSEIVDSSNGILLDKNCTEFDVCDAILKIIDMNHEMYSNLRTQSRNKWENEYNANSNYKEWISFLLRKNYVK